MDQRQPSTSRDDTAAAICARFEASEEALALLDDRISPPDYLDALIQAGLHADALRFLAFAIPIREAVWWACLCVSGALEAPSAEATAALEAARAWVIDPTDERRRAAFEAAQAADLGTPAGCVAASAFLSGGSMAPAHVQAVEPPPDVAPRLVAGSLILSGVMKEPEKAPEKYVSFLRTGAEVAEGRRPWPQAPRQPAPTAAPAPAAPPAGREGAPAHGPARRPRY